MKLRIEGRTKEDTEPWILKQFLSLYSKLQNDNFEIMSKGDEWPDYWIQNSLKEKIGVEVTEIQSSSNLNRTLRTEEIITKRIYEFCEQNKLNLFFQINDRKLPQSDAEANELVKKLFIEIDAATNQKEEIEILFEGRIDNIWLQIKKHDYPIISWTDFASDDIINSGWVDSEIKSITISAIQRGINSKKNKFYGDSTPVFLVMYFNKDVIDCLNLKSGEDVLVSVPNNKRIVLDIVK